MPLKEVIGISYKVKPLYSKHEMFFYSEPGNYVSVLKRNCSASLEGGRRGHGHHPPAHVVAGLFNRSIFRPKVAFCFPGKGRKGHVLS